MNSAIDSGLVEVVEVVTVDTSKPVCEAADMAPQAWGHKCIRHKHGRREPHHCQCGHAWYDPIEPDVSKVRTVGADLAL